MQLVDEDFFQKIVEHSLIEKIFNEQLKDGEIDPDYYFNVAGKLADAVAKGIGGSSFQIQDYRNTLKAYLDHNVFAFSAAKSLAVMDAYKSKLTDENGQPVSYSRFRDSVTPIDVEFNDNYLSAEYHSAISTAQAADKWEGLAKHDYLEYRTVGDDRVRLAHQKLDGKVFASSDTIWNVIYPPNDWGCRCTVVPARSGAHSDDPALVNVQAVKPYFRRNAGITRTVYHSDHPYFEAMTAKGLKVNELSATRNYNMKSLDQLYAAKTEMPKIKAMTAEATQKWFEKEAKNGAINIATKDGLNTQIDEAFIAKMTGNDRLSYTHKAPEVMSNPDEVWSHFDKGKLQQTYIKYYQDGPYMAVMKDSGKGMELKTFYKVDQNGEFQKKRSGVLKYRK